MNRVNASFGRVPFLLLLLCLFASLGLSQETSYGGRAMQAAIVVKEHTTGADFVTITMLEPEYPPDLLRRQVEQVGRELGGEARGIQVFRYELEPDDPNMAFLKVTFAVDGLIDREKQILRVQPLLRAFAGAPEPYTVTGLTIIFDGERPAAHTPRDVRSEAVVATAGFNDDPPLVGIEYRVQLLSQDPEAIVFPERADVEPPRPVPVAQPPGIPWIVWPLIIVAALAVGPLVYFALLRAGKKPR
jgi:hypothetical protein